MFLSNDARVFKPSEIVDILSEIDYPNMLVSGHCRINDKSVKCDYYNLASAFDIETTSFYLYDGKVITWEDKVKLLQQGVNENDILKQAIMYVWQFGIDGRVIVGRTWVEFKLMIKLLIAHMAITPTRRLIIYVHNLSYELGFLMRQLDIDTMFALDTRDPLYFVTKEGLEFRCSYHLTQMSLKHVAVKGLFKYTDVTKKVGDLDYTLLRHSRTPLTDKELGYCVADVQVVMNYIQEQIENNDDNITHVVYTSTGVSRKEFRKQTITSSRVENDYKRLIEGLTITSVLEYKLLRLAYSGGFTHANPLHINEVVKIIGSDDLVSSYPAVMVMRKYPMSKGVQVKINSREQLDSLLTTHCVLFQVTFKGLQARIVDDFYLSASKCVIRGATGNIYKNGRWDDTDPPPVIINGRIASVGPNTTVSTCIIDCDYRIISHQYTWLKMYVGTCIIYEKHYLPTPFINCLLDFYDKKNSLKGVVGKELEYNLSKYLTNGAYGMTGEDPIKDIITFDSNADTVWSKRKQTDDELKKSLQDYNDNPRRFIYFPWALWVTGYAREQLWKGIFALGHDYVYCDTDSLKYKHPAKHQNFFKSANLEVIRDLVEACDYHGISIDRVCHKGRWLGTWDFEGIYPYFKTLGAKRYMVYSPSGKTWGHLKKPILMDEDTGRCYPISITVSGVNKHVAVPYMLDHYANNINDIFSAFGDGLEIDYEGTGKMLHTYIDHDIMGTMVDYTGTVASYHERSCVHLEPTSYIVSSLAQLIANCIKIRKELN